MAEAAGAQEHEREQQEVVAGVDHDAGGERARAEADPAEHQADRRPAAETARATRPVCSPCIRAKGMLVRTEANDHGRQRPLRAEPSSCGRRGCDPVSLFHDPVVGRAEGRQQETAKGDLFEKRSERDAEGEEQPDGSGNAKSLVDGSVGRAGNQDLIGDAPRQSTPTAAPISLQTCASAAVARHCIPSKKLLCQISGKHDEAERKA